MALFHLEKMYMCVILKIFILIFYIPLFFFDL